MAEIFPQGLISFDLEATGLSPLVDEITEIGALKWAPGEPESTFSSLINPLRPIPEKTVQVNKITESMVKNSPTIAQTLPSFLSFIGSLPLVAHNAQFDLGFLMTAIHKHGNKSQENKVYCSYLTAKKTFPKLKSYKLDSLAQSFKLPSFEHHRALEDAKTCFRIFSHCLSSLPKEKRLAIKPPFTARQYKLLESTDTLSLIPSHLRPFLSHIHEQTPILINYSGGSLKLPYRPIVPMSLLPLPHNIVLYSICLVTNHYKPFLIKKIKKAKEASSHEIEQLIKEGKELANK